MSIMIMNSKVRYVPNLNRPITIWAYSIMFRVTKLSNYSFLNVLFLDLTSLQTSWWIASSLLLMRSVFFLRKSQQSNEFCYILIQIELKSKENDWILLLFCYLLHVFRELLVLLLQIILRTMANNDLNRLKVVLVEQHKTAKWLAEQMGKDPATISKWCTNTAQPSLETIKKISEILQVKMSDLVMNE